MRIGIIGTGHVAQVLAMGLVAAGHDVLLASRSPEGKTGLPAPVTGLSALASADLVINASHGGGSLDTLAEIGAQALSGKVLLDVANAVDDAKNLLYPADSLGRQMQAAYPQTQVVKSLNTVSVSLMTQPGVLRQPTAVFLSGNDAGAKGTVSAVLTDLGWAKEQQLDLGGIETARAAEHYYYLFWAMAQAQGTPTLNIAVIKERGKKG